MDYIISGIQQVGIGVKNAEEAWAMYRNHFGMDVPIFKDAAEASLMTRYTAGNAEKRFAILAMNMQGGGGFEIWQYTSRKPSPASFQPQLGDTGVFAVKMKSRNVMDSYNELKLKGAALLGAPEKMPDGRLHFFVNDPYGNLFEVVEGLSWFKLEKKSMGGIGGCMIGVSDIDKALPLYQGILGYSEIVYDVTSVFNDLKGLQGGQSEARRVLLRHPKPRLGAFSKLLGATELELVEVKGRTPRKIFKDRLWGDLGFIHLCFDVNGMSDLRENCKAKGFAFTVDSSQSFDMGKAAGHFTYIEDPDGTLIEFVETHKIPIIEKLGWYLSLKNRDREKPLANWMLNLLGLNRVKD
ncbi:MAG TPA: VOC family protein [Cyclobacteriaceae bacterium]|nr:VOC family protein [Cyclobacteriaceae bacterium]